MYESRCGILCSECEGREEVNCKGCTEMERPFWGGVCEVKKCCEDRQLDHCGVCGEFPCELTSNMGKEDYDPAPRLKQCKLWAQEEAGEK